MSAPMVLERTRALATPAIAAAVESLSPDLRRIVEYHWGWIDRDGQPADVKAGKGLRPALALLSAEAAGAPAEAGIAGAVAVEIVHDFTLLHDDVMDEDRERRGRPAAWTVFGVPQAICAGDALLLLAQRILLADPSPQRLQAVDALCGATSAVIEGQMGDLDLEGRTDASREECLAIAEAKTGALLGCAASIGACLAGAPDTQVESLRRFGEALGLAFQAVDDWLGIWGDPARTGKPYASDLRQRKASLPVAIALGSGGDARREVAEWMGGVAAPTPEALRRLVACLEKCGADEETRAIARSALTMAQWHLTEAHPTESARRALVELAEFVVEREW